MKNTLPSVCRPSPKTTGLAKIGGLLLAAAASSTALAAAMPLGSQAWMVFHAGDCPLCATSNMIGPNPPNGIPTTSFASGPQKPFGTGSAEILPDRMRSFISGFVGGFMYMSMFDTYTVHGAGAAPFVITVHLDVDGVGRSVMTTRADGTRAWGSVGSAITAEIGTFNSTTEDLHEQWRVTPFDASSSKIIMAASKVSYAGPFERPLEGAVSYSRSVSVGDVFDIGYGLTSTAGWGEVDLLHTAIISFDLPEGVYLTSSLGGRFGDPGPDPTPVPEPSSVLLLAAGLLGLRLAGRSRRADESGALQSVTRS